MKILASLTIRAIASLVILLAGLSLVLDVSQDLGFKFISSMSKAALVTKLAPASQFPVLAHFSLIFSLIVLDKKASFLRTVEALLLRLNINLKGRTVNSIVYRIDAASRDVSFEVKAVIADGVSFTEIVRIAVSLIFRGI